MLPDPKTTLSHATKKAWTLLDEFKSFTFKGNVVDLTIGVIIGTTFHKLIDSLVNNLIMPLFAMLVLGSGPYTHWKLTFRGSTVPIGLTAERRHPHAAHLRVPLPFPCEIPGLADANREG